MESVPFWDMEPAADVVKNGTAFCLANPGREYLIYLPEGKQVTVNLSGPAASFDVEWFNPATGETRKAKSVVGGGSVRLVSPLLSKDAVLYLKRSSP